MIEDPADPSYPLRDYGQWRADFAERVAEARSKPRPARGPEPLPPPEMRDPDAPPVGLVTEQSLARYAKMRASAQRRADAQQVALENADDHTPS